jgi:hypothetical protein
MGPCLGFLKCGFNNRCAYEGTKDEFVPLFRDVVLPAKKIAHAGTVHDRYLSALWQRYLERSLVVTHQPRLTGKHIAFLISGSLSLNANTREILLSWTEISMRRRGSSAMPPKRSSKKPKSFRDGARHDPGPRGP